METMQSVEELAEDVSQWCDRHGILPANGQAAPRITERNVRYYRTLGLVDPPLAGGGHGYGEKHRLQLVALRLLQAQGLPLNRIRDLLFGRTVAELQRIEKEGVAELAGASMPAFCPAPRESWSVTSLGEEFLLVSRRGRSVPPELRQELLCLLNQQTEQPRRARGARKGD
jgi:DNA-binding transcriptional MerR regulator